MSRKAIVGVILATLISVPGVFAYGIGLQFDGGIRTSGIGYGPSVTFKLDEYPVIFAANLSFHDGNFGIGISGDHWMFNEQITESLPVKWFFGYGAYATMGLGDDASFSFGGRLPVGINAFFKDGLIEPYIQIVPSIGIVLAPDLDFPDWFVPLSIGVRFWFD